MRWIMGLALIAMGVWGCSSSDSSTPPPATGGSGGSGGSGGTSVGGTGGVEAGVEAATEASAEAETPETSVDAPVDAEAYRFLCEQLWTPICQLWEKCAPFSFAYYFPNKADCLPQQSTQCLESMVAPGSQPDTSKLTACNAAWGTTTTCDNFVEFFWGNKLPADCVQAGTLDLGATCQWGMQCKSGYCNWPSDTAKCGTCEERAKADEDCDIKLCELGLVCSELSKCVSPGQLNADCTQAAPCATSLTCYNGTCQARAADAEACDTAVGNCQFNHWCNMKSHLCEPIKQLAKAGEACGYLTDGGLEGCAAGLRCKVAPNNEGTCEAYDGTCGAAANYLGGSPCEPDQVCTSDKCVDHSLATCEK